MTLTLRIAAQPRTGACRAALTVGRDPDPLLQRHALVWIATAATAENFAAMLACPGLNLLSVQ